MVDNPYDRLGVHRNASDEDIRAAAKKHAKASHPDAGGDAEEFNAGRRALAILTDPLKRKKFDDTGEIDDSATVDNIVAMARGFLDRAVGEAVSGYLMDDENPDRDPRKVDLIAIIKQAMAEEIRKAEAEVVKGERQTVFFKDFARRWRMKKKKKGEFDFLQRRFQDEMRKARETIEGVKEAIRARKMALALIDVYEFEFDAVPQWPTWDIPPQIPYGFFKVG